MDGKAQSIYRELLLEIKYRIDAIDDILGNKITYRHRIGQEYSYLQLRLICETIAIGCLVMHEQISSKKKDLFKSYKADWIISELSKLHADFYPVPLEIKDSNDEPPEFIHLKTGFLTQIELTSLWNRHAGGILHRGSVKKLFIKEKETDFSNIQKWRDKIVLLLNRHTIVSPDKTKLILCGMTNEDGEIFTQTFEALPPGQKVPDDKMVRSSR